MVARPVDLESEPSVLVADDSSAWRRAVVDVLRRAGFRTLQAGDGEEAVDVVRTELLDLVLVDFHMPRLDGIETVRHIRRHDQHLPAVMMTARPAELPVVEIRRLRIAMVLPKRGVDRRRIVSAVRMNLRPKSA